MRGLVLMPEQLCWHKNIPYVPLNRPAIGDLMSMFDFYHAHVEQHDGSAEDHHAGNDD